MNKSNDFCHVTRKLVDDLPGVHWYVQACKDCYKEYGPEFAIAAARGIRVQLFSGCLFPAILFAKAIRRPVVS